MKKTLCLLIISVATIVIANATGSPKIHLKSAKPSATFDSIWIDYNIKEEAVLGMKIHIKFTAYGMKNMDAFVAVYYTYNDEMAGVLKDKNAKLVSTAGDVALYKAIKPAYDPAIYDDLALFMPYSELDQEPGEYDLTMDDNKLKSIFNYRQMKHMSILLNCQGDWISFDYLYAYLKEEISN